MADIYVRSTDGSDADDGSTWSLAKSTLVGAAAIDAAGDTIWVSQSHSESTAASVTLTLAGSASNPTKILCGNDAAQPPTTLSDTALVATTGANSISIDGSVYCYGLTFQAANSGNLGHITFQNSNNNGIAQYYKSCTFYLAGTNAGSRVWNGNAQAGKILLEDCVFRFSAAAQGLGLSSHRFDAKNCSIHPSSTALTSALVRSLIAARPSKGSFDGCDFSNMGASADLVTVTGVQCSAEITFRNCRLPDSWTGTLTDVPVPSPGCRIEMHNCDNADTNYRLWIEDFSGTIKSETTVVKTGGASDGTTGISWSVAASANANYPLLPLVTPEIARWNSSVGSAITVTIDILHDSLTNLTDGEVWLEAQYLGTSGVPLGSRIRDAKTDILSAASDQASSASTWTTTGLTNPNKQALSVTFTPQEVGYVLAKVCLAKPSKTIYVDPELQVS